MIGTQRIIFWLAILRNVSCKLTLQSESQKVSLRVNGQLIFFTITTLLTKNNTIYST